MPRLAPLPLPSPSPRLRRLAAAASLALLALSAPAHASPGPPVTQLDDDTFPAFSSSHAAFVALVYAPWCGHSRALLPAFEQAAANLAPQLPFVALDGTQSEATASALDVKAYPTLLFLRRGATPREYSGDRTAAAIGAWAAASLRPALERPATPAAALAFAAAHARAFLLVAPAGGGEEEAFLAAAPAAAWPCAIAATHPSGGEAPALLAYAAGALAATLRPPLSVGRVERFLRVEALPLVLTYAAEAEEALFHAEVPLHLLVFHEADATPLVPALEDAARQLRGEVAVATVDVRRHAEAAEYFDATGKGSLSLPVAMVYSLANATKFACPELSTDGLVSFVRRVQRGEAEEHLRSAEERERGHAGGVVELVGTSFKRVVFDESKDVFVQFYSPACGHCRKLAPVYAQLAHKLAADDDLVVAQIDATANDVPGFIPEGFPTLIFYPKANKQGVEYDGSRDLLDMEQFIADVRAGREHIGGLPDDGQIELEAGGAKVEL